MDLDRFEGLVKSGVPDEELITALLVDMQFHPDFCSAAAFLLKHRPEARTKLAIEYDVCEQVRDYRKQHNGHKPPEEMLTGIVKKAIFKFIPPVSEEGQYALFLC